MGSGLIQIRGKSAQGISTAGKLALILAVIILSVILYFNVFSPASELNSCETKKGICQTEKCNQDFELPGECKGEDKKPIEGAYCCMKQENKESSFILRPTEVKTFIFNGVSHSIKIELITELVTTSSVKIKIDGRTIRTSDDSGNFYENEDILVAADISETPYEVDINNDNKTDIGLLILKTEDEEEFKIMILPKYALPEDLVLGSKSKIGFFVNNVENSGNNININLDQEIVVESKIKTKDTTVCRLYLDKKVYDEEKHGYYYSKQVYFAEEKKCKDSTLKFSEALKPQESDIDYNGVLSYRVSAYVLKPSCLNTECDPLKDKSIVLKESQIIIDIVTGCDKDISCAEYADKNACDTNKCKYSLCSWNDQDSKCEISIN